MKFFASHSKILDKLGDKAEEISNALRLKKIADKLEEFGANVVEITRHNVVVEMAEDRIHDLFDVVIDETQDFIGFVDSKLDDLKDYIDHLEIEHDKKHHGGS